MIRVATIADIKQIQLVRHSVTENVLSDPGLVTDDDCKTFLTERGQGWVYVIDNKVVGFSIVDVIDHNVWALFIHPAYEKKGIGKKLHWVMLDWYFKQTDITLWLGTSPNTRAENFYKIAGWKAVGLHADDEIKFEMTKAQWVKKSVDG